MFRNISKSRLPGCPHREIRILAQFAKTQLGLPLKAVAAKVQAQHQDQLLPAATSAWHQKTAKYSE